MFRKKPIIKFESVMEEYPDILVPSKNVIPEWYKKIPKWRNGQVVDSQNNINVTLKQCVPFLNVISSGYMLLLPYDLHVRNDNGSPYIVWSDISNPPKFRNNVADPSLVPTGCYPLEYIWNTNISFEVPKGYSVLLTHPLNRNDLPFVTLSGIIDGGYITNPHGAYPFYIKSGFEGIIEQGTPIAQLIPFKQDSWVSKKSTGLSKIGILNSKKSNLVFSGWYKKNHWTRKDYS
jgi:hypothetical protein